MDYLTSTILTPVLALVVWSLVVWVWMYATRLPAFRAAGIDPQEAKHPGTYGDRIPSGVRAVADNYNHLMEQPTIFYAAALAAQIAGQADGTNVALAWTYVILRVVHSLIQCTVNVVAARFAMFALSTIALAVLTIRVALAVF